MTGHVTYTAENSMVQRYPYQEKCIIDVTFCIANPFRQIIPAAALFHHKVHSLLGLNIFLHDLVTAGSLKLIFQAVSFLHKSIIKIVFLLSEVV